MLNGGILSFFVTYVLILNFTNKPFNFYQEIGIIFVLLFLILRHFDTRSSLILNNWNQA